MEKRIKFIWDFYGPRAQPTAQHHVKHLGEFVEGRKIENSILGVEQEGPAHFIAYMVVESEQVETLRQILKPKRGQYYDE